jgi:hypothetical protein
MVPSVFGLLAHAASDPLRLRCIERNRSFATLDERPETTNSPRRTLWRAPWFRVLASFLALIGLTFVLAVVYVSRHAEPILHKRIIETLSKRFNSPVQLDELHISITHGLQVQGSGLRILYLAGPTQPLQEQNPPPMLSVRNFSFRTSLRDLLHLRARVAIVYVQGLEIHIPPHHADTDDPSHHPTQPKIALLVDRILCTDAKLFIETTPKPGHAAKDPLEFDIPSLDLTDVGSNKPMTYQADVINPKPRGNVHAFGHIGPWQGADPRATPLDGDYRFDHADFNTIKGLGGTLSSVGHFTGQLGHLTIDGTTSTPNFSLDISNHPMPLTTTFHAFVDGTSGDTTLAPVQATLGSSHFTCSGAVLRVKGKGHDIDLTVDMPHGRIEDILQLSLKTNPPPIDGTVTMHAHLHIPPGEVRVAAKIELAGDLTITGVHFSNAKLQDRVDSLSMRAQGKPEEVKAAGSDRQAQVASRMAVNFALSHELMSVNSLGYQIPGAKVDMHGAYSLDGNLYEFKGHVRTQATASQMTTGWKSMLLKAIDPLLEKNGAGLELPLSITGTKNDFKLGLAMHDVDETPADMAKDLKNHRQLHPPDKP